ncbi:MAG: hypothetical protein GF350_08610, partial [Chitinivibrionales bacterium]|nr:hypothetical protein [Chitinivibrionales bacterium]
MSICKLLSVAAIASLLFAIGGFSQNNCTWVKDYNSNLQVHICIEESPEDIGNLEVKAVLPSEQFMPVYAQVGDTVRLKYIKGQNISKKLFVGFLNRTGRAPIVTSHDPSEMGDYMLGPGTKHSEAGHAWDSPVYWPS